MVPEKVAGPITMVPIGFVENGFEHLARPEEIKAVESRIVLAPDLTEGLTGLQSGDRLLVVFYFDRSEPEFELLQHPRHDASRPKRGVFSLCSPHRPNLIGVTVVDLVAIDGNVLTVRDLDAVNGTPVLDLKPVV